MTTFPLIVKVWHLGDSGLKVILLKFCHKIAAGRTPALVVICVPPGNRSPISVLAALEVRFIDGKVLFMLTKVGSARAGAV